MAKRVAKVYGDALVADALASHTLDGIYEEILSLKPIFAPEGDLGRLLDSPKIIGEEKQRVLEEVFLGRISSQMMGFLSTILEKKRQRDLIPIFDYALSAIKEIKKIGVATVTSAYALTEVQKKAIVKRLLETTGYVTFEMTYLVDESLLGGLIIRVKDRVVDSSIKTAIAKMRRTLL